MTSVQSSDETHVKNMDSETSLSQDMAITSESTSDDAMGTYVDTYFEEEPTAGKQGNAIMYYSTF